MIQKDGKLSIRRQCELLGVNRSSLSYTPAPTDEARIALQEELMRRIDYWHVKSPYLGSRKITVKLREEGYKVGRKTVRKLM